MPAARMREHTISNDADASLSNPFGLLEELLYSGENMFLASVIRRKLHSLGLRPKLASEQDEHDLTERTKQLPMLALSFGMKFACVS